LAHACGPTNDEADVTGDEIVRNIDERVVELRKALAKIEAEIAHSFADHREQAERLGREMDAIQADVLRRMRQVIER
jgi:hypothetical protein